MEISELEAKLKRAEDEVRACLDFMQTEMGWEYFREEMLYFDNEPKRTESLENARKLRNFLSQSRERGFVPTKP